MRRAPRPGSLAPRWRELGVLAPTAFLAVLGVAALLPGLAGAGDPLDCVLSESLAPPRPGHWFGFDVQGCDGYAQSIHGARSSLAIAGIVVSASALLGVVVGGVAGYVRGPLDAVVGRVTDLAFAVPLVLGGMVVLSLVDVRGITQVSLVLTVLGWPPFARLMRSSVLAVAREPYVEAARALGAGDLRILRRHVLPNALGPVLVYATVYVGVVITAEALLSFAGVGLQLPAVSWGVMLSEIGTRILEAPHLLLPGVLLAATVGSCVVLGEALRRATGVGRL